MTSRARAFDGFAFDDDSFDCDFWSSAGASTSTAAGGAIGLLLALTGGSISVSSVETWTPIPVATPSSSSGSAGLLLALAGGGTSGWVAKTRQAEVWTPVDDRDNPL